MQSFIKLTPTSQSDAGAPATNRGRQVLPRRLSAPTLTRWERAPSVLSKSDFTPRRRPSITSPKPPACPKHARLPTISKEAKNLTHPGHAHDR